MRRGPAGPESKQRDALPRLYKTLGDRLMAGPLALNQDSAGSSPALPAKDTRHHDVAKLLFLAGVPINRGRR